MYSVQRTRNTHVGHTGQMASWQMRGVPFAVQVQVEEMHQRHYYLEVLVEDQEMYQEQVDLEQQVKAITVELQQVKPHLIQLRVVEELEELVVELHHLVMVD